MPTATPSPDLIQVHLIGAATRKQIAVYAAMVAGLKEGQGPPPLPAWKFHNFSGRGVRFRVLTPEEREMATACAARDLGAEALLPEFSARKARECVHRMIVEVTEKRELHDLAGARWMKVNQEQLEEKGGDKAFSALFGTKDYETLIGLYNRYHVITQDDLDAVEGNAVEVSGEG